MHYGLVSAVLATWWKIWFVFGSEREGLCKERFLISFHDVHQSLMNTDHHYMRFSVSPKTADVLSLRQAIQSALVQTFGIAGGSGIPGYPIGG